MSKNPPLQIYTAFQRHEDGTYTAAPEGSFGKSYLLTEEQFRVYESWIVGKLQKPVSFMQSLASTSPLLACLLIALCALFSALLFGYLNVDIASVILVPLVGLILWALFRQIRTKNRRMAKTFPFPDAEEIRYTYSTYFKRYLIATATTRSAITGAWIILILGIANLLAYGLPLIKLAYLGQVEPYLGFWVLGGLNFATSLGLALTVFIPRYRFKKRTGRKMNLKNLYNSETGRKLA